MNRRQNKQHRYWLTCGGVEHVMLMHPTLGPVFPAHHVRAEGLLMESRLLECRHWGCHHFARWVLEGGLWSCEVVEKNLTELIFHTKKVDSVLTARTTRCGGHFLVRQLQKSNPLMSVAWS